jgi:hypothetical protein
MVMTQPFILAGPPESLQYLKDYGFKTFGSVWDESYDQIQDHGERLDAIIDLINHLGSLPKEKFDQMLERCASIVEHNRSWFYDFKFQDILFCELQKNFSTAFELQKYLETEYPGGPYAYLYNRMLDDKVEIPNFHQTIMSEFLTLSNQAKDILVKYPKLANLFE